MPANKKLPGEWTVANMVIKWRLGCEIDVSKFAKQQGIRLNRRKFPGAIRHKSNKESHLIFPSGLVILTGCTSEQSAKQSAKELLTLLKPFCAD